MTILHGQFRQLGPPSKSILITADRGLALAARAEGARVWECTSEPPRSKIESAAGSALVVGRPELNHWPGDDLTA